MNAQASSHKICRWGILGTAGIARKNWTGIHHSGNGRVAAVASRSAASAQKFIDECNAEVPFAQPALAMDGYETLIQSDLVDAIYIPLPTAMRKEWVIRAAEAGKHVLCEKPIAITATDAKEMIDACAQNNVQFMDGVMFMHGARLPQVQAMLKDPNVIGKLRRITSHFCFSGDAAFQADNIRVQSQLEPHGCLGDVGWYNIRITLAMLDYQMPTHVVAHELTSLQGKGSETTVPGEYSAELFFEDGVTASFYCSFLTELQQMVVAGGDKGFLAMDDFVLPFFGSESTWTTNQHVFDVQNVRYNMRRHTTRHAVTEYSNGQPTAQEVNMAARFADIAMTGKIDPFWPDVALKTQQVLDACVRSSRAGGVRVEL
jgi:predicted dehydrogenase